MTYYCAFCGKEVPEHEVVRIPGLMHTVCKSGRALSVNKPE